MVGHVSQVREIGDFFTFEVAGEPLLIIRGEDEQIRAFYNICPHRGALVERSEEGNKKIFQCIYHGWTFQPDGKVHRAPNFKGAQLGNHHCLAPVRLEVHHSLIFVNLDNNAPSMQETHQDFLNNFGQYTFLDSLKKVRERKRVIQANWKAVIDNYLECDHCPVAHPGFSKTFDLSNYTFELRDNYSYQYAKLRNGQEKKDAARFFWVWPNLMISVYPGTNNITTSQIVPLDEKSSLAVYRYYFVNEDLSPEDEELIKFVDQVREEDFVLVELLQKGLPSKAYGRGIYSPTERALHHFHEIYQKNME